MKTYTVHVSIKNLFYYHVAFALFGYCLMAPLSDLIFPDSEVGYLSILYRFLVVVSSLFFITVIVFYKNNLRITAVGKMALSTLILFWCIYSLRFFYDVTFQSKYLGDDTFISYLIYGYGFVLVPLFSLMMSYDRQDLVKIFTRGFYILLVGVVLIIIVSTYQVIMLESLWGVRLATERINPISFGKYSAVLFLLAYALSQLKARPVNVYYFAMFIGGVGVLLSGSRGALVSLCVVLLIDVFASLKLKNMIIIPILISVTLYFTMFILSFLLPDFNLIDNYSKMGSSVDQSAQIRFQLFNGALNQFYSSPIIGDLIVERTYKFYPHNHILEVLMATGILGFFIYLLLNALVVIKLYQLRRSGFSRVLVNTLVNLYLFFFVAGMFSGALVASEGFWFILVIICLTSFENKRNSYAY